MIEIDKFLAQGRLLLQVHDELLFEIAEGKVEECVPVIKKIMEGVIPEKERNGIPFTVEGKAGKNWGEMEPI